MKKILLLLSTCALLTGCSNLASLDPQFGPSTKRGAYPSEEKNQEDYQEYYKETYGN